MHFTLILFKAIDRFCYYILSIQLFAKMTYVHNVVDFYHKSCFSSILGIDMAFFQSKGCAKLMLANIFEYKMFNAILGQPLTNIEKKSRINLNACFHTGTVQCFNA